MKTTLKQVTLLLLLCHGLAEAQTVTHGAVEFRIKDEESRELIPGKLVFLQNGVPAALPARSGQAGFSRDNLLYSARGKGRITLPAGRYEIWAGHGIEYSVSRHTVTIKDNQEKRLEFSLRREVDTRGYSAADLRLHAPSLDTGITEHLISCVAEGLKWGVVTDPKRAVDYEARLSQLAFSPFLKTVVGADIRTAFGHFGVYPVPTEFEDHFAGIDDAGRFFQALRSLSTDPVIQVNAPRHSRAGYFTSMHLDPDFAIPRDSAKLSWEFDAIEVLPAEDGLWSSAGVDQAIPAHQDWYNLLNSGYRFTAVGSAGNHDLIGLPHTYIASSTDTPAELSDSELIAGLRSNHVVVNRGIFIDMEVHGGFPVGRQVTTKNGFVTFDVRVQAPTWVACDTLKLIANGRVKHTLILKEDRIPERLLGSITVRPTVDTWYVMTATGSRPLAPMYTTPKRGLMPLGFTNPIWVDADGDGQFTSVKERAVALVDTHHNTPQVLIEHIGDDPVLLKFVVGCVGHHDFENKSELLEKLLAPAKLNLRLRIYEFLSQQEDAMAEATLWFRARTAVEPRESVAIALARYRRGETEQWQAALEHAKRVAHASGVREAFKPFPARPLRNWQIVGPFEIMQTEIFDHVFAAGQKIDLTATYETLTWQSHEAAESGRVALDELYGADDHAIAYAYTEFHATTSGDMLFKLSSDDGIVIWLNGEEVHRNYAEKSPHDLVVLPVNAGKNTILLRDENRGGDWGFAVEVVDELGWIE